MANEGTGIPGGTGTFTGFYASSQSGSDTAFKGFGTQGQVGLYVASGEKVIRVVDPSVPVPVHSDPTINTFLSDYSAASIAAGNVVFCGVNADGNKGLYIADLGGKIRVIADTTTPIPGGAGNFTDFALREAIDDQGDIAFVGFGAGGQEGVYSLVNGSLRVIANQVTSLPGGTGTFAHFNSIAGLSASNGAVTFMGAGGERARRALPGE